MADWASLPPELINLVADRLLVSDDLDCYVDLRAVCGSWRAASADPKKSPPDPRFLPRQWVLLEELYQSDDARLFVNSATGRIVRKDLTRLCQRYIILAGAVGGMLVLVERSPPHGTRLFNPFTGLLTRFRARPAPRYMEFVVANVIRTSPPTLVLLCNEGPIHHCNRTIYWANPDSESFNVYEWKHGIGPTVAALASQAVIGGGVYAAAREHGSLELDSVLVPVTNKILELEPRFPDHFRARPEFQNESFLVESSGDILVLFRNVRLACGFEVFKIDITSGEVEPVKNIGSRALFVDRFRSLSVVAAHFPSVEANCIYHIEVPRSSDISIYSLDNKKEVRFAGPILSCPFSDVQLLCQYGLIPRRPHRYDPSLLLYGMVQLYY